MVQSETLGWKIKETNIYETDKGSKITVATSSGPANELLYK